MTITREDVIREAHKLPRDTKNVGAGAGCVYLAPTGERCIAGQIFHQLGYEIPSAYNRGTDVARLHRNRVVPMNEEAVDLLLEIQMSADRGNKWGRVVDHHINSTAAFLGNYHVAPLEDLNNRPSQAFLGGPVKTFTLVAEKTVAAGATEYIDRDLAPGVPRWTDSKSDVPFTTKDIFEYTGVPESTLRRWRTQGIIDNIHYPTEVQWAPIEAKIARVLSRLPAFSPELYLKIAGALRAHKDWSFTALVVTGADCEIVFTWALEETLNRAQGKHITLLHLGNI